jgi:hypothetical protein
LIFVHRLIPFVRYAQQTQQGPHFIAVTVHPPLVKRQDPKTAPDKFMSSIFAVVIEQLQGLVEIFFFKQGAIPRDHAQGQFGPIQRRDKGTRRLQMIAHGCEHRLKELLQVTARQESLFDILQ